VFRACTEGVPARSALFTLPRRWRSDWLCADLNKRRSAGYHALA